MKQTKLMVMAMMAVALMATSCASKKDLQNCQNENKELLPPLNISIKTKTRG